MPTASTSFSFTTTGVALGPVDTKLAAAYIDQLEYETPTEDLVLINCVPADQEDDVLCTRTVDFQLASLGAAAIDAVTQIYISSAINSTRVLAYDQADGGFKNGFSGSATPRQSAGSAVNDELVFSIVAPEAFTSLDTITVEITAQLVGSGTVYPFSYSFVVEDLTKPELTEILWFTPFRCRVKFSEPVLQTDDVGGAQFVKYWPGGAEILDATHVKIAGARLSEDWVGQFVALYGSIIPTNNGTRVISGVDITAGVLTVTPGALAMDSGDDTDAAGTIVQRRTISATISSYKLAARLAEEGAGTYPLDAERTQVAFCPMPTAAAAVPASELLDGENPDEYVYLTWHDGISFGRLYTLYAVGPQDVWENAADSELDFTPPTFGRPAKRFRMWSTQIIPGTDMKEDLEASCQLRKMAVVLQDAQDQLWYAADQIQQAYDPYSCPDHWLDWLLIHEGNPFTFPLETNNQKRKLLAALRGFYRNLGSDKNIEDMLFTLLDIHFEVVPYNTRTAWVLGDPVKGRLGYTTTLAPSTARMKNSYNIISPVILTNEERRVVWDVATWADPIDLHLVRIVEPGHVLPGLTGWILGVSVLGTNTTL
jgi:hypothetical protein